MPRSRRRRTCSSNCPRRTKTSTRWRLRLAAELPKAAELPRTKDAAIHWQGDGRTRLADIVRAKHYEVQASQRETGESAEDIAASFWWLEMGSDWTVPAVVLEPKGPRATAVVIADAGRAGVAAEAAKLLAAGTRVVAIDPFCFGDSSPEEGRPRSGRGMLFTLMVSAAGERPIGVQASQVAAAARWAAKQYPEGSVRLASLGPMASTIGLIAAALEPAAIQCVELHDSLGSLKQTIEENWSARERPEMFCFGLLESFDILHLAALAAPREVRFAAPSERVRRELAPLKTWYETLGSQFDPIR